MICEQCKNEIPPEEIYSDFYYCGKCHKNVLRNEHEVKFSIQVKEQFKTIICDCVDDLLQALAADYCDTEPVRIEEFIEDWVERNIEAFDVKNAKSEKNEIV